MSEAWPPPTTSTAPAQEVDARQLPPVPRPRAGGDQRLITSWADLLLLPLWLLMMVLLLIGLAAAGGPPPPDPEDRG